jgi:nucleotide-binding universal stress UspA family protein
MRTIVVPLDGSAFAESALRVARHVVDCTGESLRLLVVSTSATVDADADYLQRVTASLGVQPVLSEQRLRRPGQRVASLICRVAEDAGEDALVCMTAHGRTGLGEMLLGSTTEEVLRLTRRPVLVVGRTCSPSWPDEARLLVPLDGSDRGEQILPEAAGVAVDWNLETSLLQVVHPFDNETAQHLGAALTAAQERMRGLGVETKTDILFATNPAQTISQQARELGAALVIMSSHVHPGPARTLLGSVTMGVIHHAPCPVLVCPPPADELVERQVVV